ncbi:hypothetical protein KY366_02675 [Candidatus Woesearchaeota archaeon]|nr:hypothetical protein [Candidatus Woesearchaeota archaeon]
MYTEIRLHNGKEVEVRFDELSRLNNTLADLCGSTSRLADDVNLGRKDIVNALLEAGSLADEAFKRLQEEIGLLYNEPHVLDEQISPGMSLCYFYLGSLYSEIVLATSQQKEIFYLTKEYFEDMYLLQVLSDMEFSRGDRNDKIAYELGKNLEELAPSYKLQVSRQTREFQILSYMLLNRVIH